MLRKIWRILTAIPQALNALLILRTDAQACLGNEKMSAAWEVFLNDPAIAGSVPRFSAEWRALEEAIQRLK